MGARKEQHSSESQVRPAQTNMRERKWASLAMWWLFFLVAFALLAAAMSDSGFIAAIGAPKTWILAVLLSALASVQNWFSNRR